MLYDKNIKQEKKEDINIQVRTTEFHALMIEIRDILEKIEMNTRK